MSSHPVPSALDVRTQAFPSLTAAQINRVRLGSKREVKKGALDPLRASPEATDARPGPEPNRTGL
jgi:hypothetical protein